MVQRLCLLGLFANACHGLDMPGVEPEKAPLYAPVSDAKGQVFKCLDGQGVVMYSALNDDYCDCQDGSDEPSTDACSGVGPTQRLFYCENLLSQKKYIFDSRVNDGVCDCCDATDEPATGKCKNTCDMEGKAWRDVAEAKRADFDRSKSRRSQLIAEAKVEVEQWTEEVKSAQKAVETTQKNTEGLWQEYEGLGGNEEHLETKQYLAFGIDKNAPKRLKEVVIRCGNLIDFIGFYYTDGTSDAQGDARGDLQEPFLLEEDEYLWKISGKAGDKLDSIQFETNKHRKSPWYGGRNGQTYSFTAKRGMQIWGVKRMGRFVPEYEKVIVQNHAKIASIVERAKPDLSGVTTTTTTTGPKISEYAKWMDGDSEEAKALAAKEGKEGGEPAGDEAEEKPAEPAPDDQSWAAKIQKASQKMGLPPLEAARKMFLDTRGEFEKAESRLTKIEQKVELLVEKTQPDLPDDEREVYFSTLSLAEKCLQLADEGYTYTICFEKTAKQDTTLLGKWAGWSGTVANFEDGDQCPGNIKRRLRVKLLCGGVPPAWARLISVKEMTTCSYEAMVFHPAGCSESSKLEETERPAIKPDDLDAALLSTKSRPKVEKKNIYDEL